VSPCFNFCQGIAHVVDTADAFQIQLDSFTRLQIEQMRCTAPGERAYIPSHADMKSALSEHGERAVLNTTLSGYVDLNLIYRLMGQMDGAYHAASRDFWDSP